MPETYDAVVVGTGFGGAISACRLAKRWPNQVVVFERGKRYPMGAFPRSPHDVARNFWNLPNERRSRPGKMRKDEQHGLFDVRSFRHMDAVLGCGLGGGSLIYANVFLMPPEHVFNDRWVPAIKRDKLWPYYEVAKEVLGSRPIPQNDDPRRRVIRTERFREFAKSVGKKSELVDLNVFFGNDFENPLPIGHQDQNRYGAVQTSCRYCAECDIGCNYHSKNTLDLNYLHVAEHRYGADIRTEHIVEKICPVNANETDDPDADGSHGYRVYFRNLLTGRELDAVLAKRVVISAGTLGSTELLMRGRDIDKTLPRVSDRLGTYFSGNGDFLGWVISGDKAADPNYGPVITQKTDFNLYEDFDPERAFLLEDAGYPILASWFTEGIKPGVFRLGALGAALRSFLDRFLRGGGGGSLGAELNALMGKDLSYNTAVLLCMGLDNSNGVLKLDSEGWVEIDWPYRESLPLYRAIIEAGKAFKDLFNAKTYFPTPAWSWPVRRNVTVHALGGCTLAYDSSSGVTSADASNFGEVFGYQGLYVADGALLPSAVGANPTATISALSEMVAQSITGLDPDANL